MGQDDRKEVCDLPTYRPLGLKIISDESLALRDELKATDDSVERAALWDLIMIIERAQLVL